MFEYGLIPIFLVDNVNHILTCSFFSSSECKGKEK